jgi:hypothetical protein
VGRGEVFLPQHDKGYVGHAFRVRACVSVTFVCVCVCVCMCVCLRAVCGARFAGTPLKITQVASVKAAAALTKAAGEVRAEGTY